MKAKVRKKLGTTFVGISPRLAAVVVCFVLGVAVGCVFVIGSEKNLFANLIGNDLNSFISNGTYEYSFFKTFFNLIKYPAVLFLLAFTAFGVVAVPFVIFVKGAMISISISSVVAAYGKKGILAALSLFGVQSAVSIPCLLVMGALAFDVSRAFLMAFKAPNRQFSGNKPNLVYFALVFLIFDVLLLFAALFDAAVTPALVSMTLKTIL